MFRHAVAANQSAADRPYQTWHLMGLLAARHRKLDEAERLYRQALGTVDEKKRAQIIKDMQRMEYNDGGLIIWGFKNLTDGYSAKVGGYKVDRGTLNLNKYGNGFRTIYFV